jgi:hypothetical protein
MKTYWSKAIFTVSVSSVLFLFVGTARADDWGFSINPGGLGFYIGDDDHHHNHGHHGGYGGYYYNVVPRVYTPSPNYYYQRPGGYYPSYNPTVRRDFYGNTSWAPDGTVHQENVSEDRRASYYSPGRNEAITKPQTTVTQEYGPYGHNRTVERTTWIGADGLPHSTTVDRHTHTDPWGNSRTDTNVTLKSKNNENAPKGDGPTLMPEPQNQQDNQSNFSKPPSKAPSKKN